MSREPGKKVPRGETALVLFEAIVVAASGFAVVVLLKSGLISAVI